MIRKFVIYLTIVPFCILCGCTAQQKVKKADILSSSNNSRNSLEWMGTYHGILPCADCEGIQTIIRLDEDLTCVVKTIHIGKRDSVFESKGSFIWTEEGNTIILKGEESTEDPKYYSLGENTLTRLDQNGNKITGKLSDQYILTKVNTDLTGKYWKLAQLYGNPVVLDENYRQEPHIILNLEGNRLTGHGWCNSFSGNYELKTGNRIAFSKMASTMMACINMEIETQLFEVLDACDNYAVQGEILSLNKGRRAPLAKFQSVYMQ